MRRHKDSAVLARRRLMGSMELEGRTFLDVMCQLAVPGIQIEIHSEKMIIFKMRKYGRINKRFASNFE